MAVDLDGTNDRIDWPNVANMAGSAITISCWVNLDVLGANIFYFAHCESSVPSPGLIFFHAGSTGAGVLQVTRSGATAKTRDSAAGSVTTGANTHLLCTDTGSSTGTDIRMYVNGVEVTYNTANNGATEIASSGLWIVGGRSTDNLRNLNGRVWEPGIWNRVLSAGEITMLANAYAPRFIRTGLLWAPSLVNVNVGLVDSISGKIGTPQNGPVAFAHGRIIYPASRTTRRYATGAPASTLQQRLMLVGVGN